MADPQWELVFFSGVEGSDVKWVHRLAVPGGWIYEVANSRRVGQELDRNLVFVPARQAPPPPKPKSQPAPKS